MSRRESERLQDILEAISKIERKVTSRDKFLEDEMLQAWALLNLQIIGEASNKLSPQTQEANPQIPWRKIIGLRNLIAHEYFRIDLGIVWDILEKDLPTLKQNIQSLVQEK